MDTAIASGRIERYSGRRRTLHVCHMGMKKTPRPGERGAFFDVSAVS